MSVEVQSPNPIPETPPSTPETTHPELRPSPARKRKSGATRLIIWLLVIALLAGAGYWFWRNRVSQPAKNGTATGAPGGAAGGRRGGGATSVSVAKVTKGDLGIYIESIGTVTPLATVTITSRVTGQLMSVNYKEGQIVKKGDLLAVIDPKPYAAALLQAEGQLQRDQASLKNANIDEQRYKAALDQHAIPEQTYATQVALVAQDQGIVRLDQGNLDAAQVNLDYTKITSPIDGRIGLRLVDPGNIVIANATTGLLTITQLQPITVIFTPAEDYLPQIAPQLRAGRSLKVEALERKNETKIADGSVLTVDNQIDTTTGTVKVRAIFQNTDNRLFPNEFVNAKLLVETLNGVNLIPVAAIQRDNDRSYVYVLQGKTVHSRNITVGHIEGTQAAVTGVVPGDTLIVDGFDRLTDGATVSVRQANGAPVGKGTTAGGKANSGNGTAKGGNKKGTQTTR
jgi:multidrug efflux system membrane fusion protein